MTSNPRETSDRSWLEASGLVQILRTLKMAMHPTKLAIGVVAILLTLVLGRVLDEAWKMRSGVDGEAITRFMTARALDQEFESKSGSSGIFEVWLAHERRCAEGLLSSSLPGASVVGGTPAAAFLASQSPGGTLSSLTGMAYGVWWMARYHTIFFLLFGVCVLGIWSLAGGAMCRCAAVEFARDDRLTMSQAVRFARSKWLGGFFLAPCVPVAFVLMIVALMIFGGMVLRIPVFGDLLAGGAFGLAILGGLVITAIALGLVVGGSLFWPAVAVEGSDAFDAFTRGFSYPFSKPWKFILYTTLGVVYAAVCWMLANVFLLYTFKITRGVVAIGSSWFGWWGRGGEGEPVSKIEALWPVPDWKGLYSWPEWSGLAWYEYFSAVMIGLYVLLVIAALWSFLASFYFSGSTVIYLLLRRDVDEVDLDDICLEEEDEETTAQTFGDEGRGTGDEGGVDGEEAAPEEAAVEPEDEASTAKGDGSAGDGKKEPATSDDAGKKTASRKRSSASGKSRKKKTEAGSGADGDDPDA